MRDGHREFSAVYFGLQSHTLMITDYAHIYTMCAHVLKKLLY